jgi:hypothetical protein
MAQLSPSEVVTLWKKYSTDIPARFALGSAYHESHYNPGENDIGDQPNQADSTSYGLYQLNRTEQAAALVFGDLNDADTNTKVFAAVQATRLAAIRAASGGDDHGDDVWAYLGMSHNMGLGSTLKTIAQHGLDWQAYKDRNPDLKFVTGGYGDDCISGGPDWSNDFDSINSPSGGAGAGTDLILKYLLLAGAAFLLWNIANGREPLAGIGV